MGQPVEGECHYVLSHDELNEAILVASCSSGPTAHALGDWIWTMIFGQLGLKIYERHTFMTTLLHKVYVKTMKFVCPFASILAKRSYN